MSDVKNGFKMYEPGLICRGKQYAENTTFEEEGGKLCGAGMMHYCVNPLDCLDYYPLINDEGKLNEFTTVTAEEEPAGDGKKYATKKLHVGVKLDLKGFIKAAFDFLWGSSEHSKLTKDADNSAKLASSGDYAKLASSGYYAQLASYGEDSVVAGIGIDNVAKAALGNWIVLAEWVWNEEKQCCTPAYVKAAKVDGETIKADTFYKLENGNFVEVDA